ncbi:MAG: sulfate adenylyltransferase [Ignavibacteria bacterium]|nr:sulfate adenylyltransferase [Ignavibacteria bacterium]
MSIQNLIKPHGSDELVVLILSGKELAEEQHKASKLPHVVMSSRETGDLIMLGIGGFTPLTGFMGYDDWKGVVKEMKMTDGLFWPIPITLSVDDSVAKSLKKGSEIALYSDETKELMGTMKVSDIYNIDKELECKEVFRTNDPKHPGVQMVMEQKSWNIAGEVKVVSESYFPKDFAGLYQRPDESRKIFAERGWRTIAALQLRNPMHRSHEYLAKIALEVVDGLYIHQLVGNLKPGDIPADVRVKCIDSLVENYFVKGTVLCGGYPLDMRYAGPKEALLHAIFRQNFGCTHLIVGRDHAGVGDYYGPFDAQTIFYEIPEDALKLKPLPIDWTFYCYKCEGMASMKTCPHDKTDRLFLSGTALRKGLSEGGEIPKQFSRPEILKILQDYYATLTEKVEIKMHQYATGDVKK